MGMVVRSNIMAYNANRQLGMNNNAVAKSLEKLSSGFRINRAGDDASGLAISEKMKAQIKGLETASSNSQDGISLVQTAEGALTEVHSMLNRMVELATKAANGTMDDNVDRASLQKEVNELKSEIDRIAEGTNFNGIKLLDGSLVTKGITPPSDLKVDKTDAVSTTSAEIYEIDITDLAATADGKVTLSIGGKDFTVDVAKDDDADAIGAKLATEMNGAFTDATAGAFAATYASGVITLTSANNEASTELTGMDKVSVSGGGLKLQIGDTADSFNQLGVKVGDMSSTGLAINDISVADADSAAKAIETIKSAINTVSSSRADLGAVQNRLEYTINNLDVAAENMSAANSRIRDTDMAKEMMNYTKMNVLTQAAQAMLAQANQQPQSVLQLLQ